MVFSVVVNSCWPHNKRVSVRVFPTKSIHWRKRRRLNGHFNLVRQRTLVAQWQQRNLPKNVLHVQSLYFCLFSRFRRRCGCDDFTYLVTLPRKTIMRRFCLKNRRIDGKRVTKSTSAIWLSIQRLIIIWHVAVRPSRGMTSCKRFALCKGIQDSLGF